MIEFLVFLVCVGAGMTVGGFLGWLLMRRLWSGRPVNKDAVGGILAAIIAIFSATR